MLSVTRVPVRALLVAACAAGAAVVCRSAGLAPVARAPCPTPAAAPSPAQSLTIDSAVLGEKRAINVYTPPGYAEHPDGRFPVLCMPDGGMDEDFPHVTEAVQAGIAWGGVRPMIVVGIPNTDRCRDLTGPTEVADERKAAPRWSCPRSRAW